MTFASFLPRRRVLVLCLASVLLHYLAIDWVGAHIGPPQAQASARAAIVAQLHPAQPLSAPAPPPPPPKQERRPRKPAPRPARIVTQAQLPALAEAALALAPAPDMQQAAELLQEIVPVAAAQLPEASPAPPGAARYKVDVPPSAELTLDVARTDPDGTAWYGVGNMSWKRGGNAYSLSVEAGLDMLITRLNLLVLTSEGSIGESGIAPLISTEKRRGRTLTATHFNQQEGRITFSASQRSYALLPGAQDKGTLPLQLAGIGRADPGQFGQDIEIMVGEDKDAAVFRFVVVGQEQIETGLGEVRAWHLTRPPLAGSYKSRLDVWLAPEHNWYPVRIRNTEANGAVTTQTVSKIVITDSGK